MYLLVTKKYSLRKTVVLHLVLNFIAPKAVAVLFIIPNSFIIVQVKKVYNKNFSIELYIFVKFHMAYIWWSVESYKSYVCF